MGMIKAYPVARISATMGGGSSRCYTCLLIKYLSELCADVVLLIHSFLSPLRRSAPPRLEIRFSISHYPRSICALLSRESTLLNFSIRRRSSVPLRLSIRVASAQSRHRRASSGIGVSSRTLKRARLVARSRDNREVVNARGALAEALEV